MKDYLKYPKALAKTETTSRRQYNSEKIKIENENDRELLLKKGTYTLSNVYPYLFDGITALCTDFADKQYEGKDGKVHDIIEGQDSQTMTHYHSMVPARLFLDLCLQGDTEYTDGILNEFYRLARNPEKKRMPFNADYDILTEPVRVDFILENGEKIPESKLNQLINIGATSTIAFISIDFYKPLFSCLLIKGKKGTTGNNYLQIPRGLQANLRSCINVMDKTGFFTQIRYKRRQSLPEKHRKELEKCDIDAMDARRVYLYLAQHQEDKADHTTVDALDFALSCFPSYVVFDKNNNPKIAPRDGFIIREKIIDAIIAYKILAICGQMEGGKFVPMDFGFDPNRVKYDLKNKTYRVGLKRQQDLKKLSKGDRQRLLFSESELETLKSIPEKVGFCL